MEIIITQFFNQAPHRDYFASAAELGQDAGKLTWNHAMEDAPEYALLDTPEKLAEGRAFFLEFGAWSEQELAAMTDAEINALMVQNISGDIREVPDMTPENWDWEEYERLAKAGVVVANMFLGDGGEIYYCLAS